MFGLEHCEVEADRIADHDARSDPVRERRQDRVRPFRRLHVLVRDAVDRGGGGRNGHVRVDQAVEGFFGKHGAAVQRHGAHLQDPVPAGVEAGGLGVERNRLQRRPTPHLPSGRSSPNPAAPARGMRNERRPRGTCSRPSYRARRRPPRERGFAAEAGRSGRRGPAGRRGPVQRGVMKCHEMS